jgi:hypothetical protein
MQMKSKENYRRTVSKLVKQSICSFVCPPVHTAISSFNKTFFCQEGFSRYFDCTIITLQRKQYNAVPARVFLFRSLLRSPPSGLRLAARLGLGLAGQQGQVRVLLSAVALLLRGHLQARRRYNQSQSVGMACMKERTTAVPCTRQRMN